MAEPCFAWKSSADPGTSIKSSEVTKDQRSCADSLLGPGSPLRGVRDDSWEYHMPQTQAQLLAGERVRSMLPIDPPPIPCSDGQPGRGPECASACPRRSRFTNTGWG